MRVLIIKTSSMGDILHTMPAISDAKKALPVVSFDWLVESQYADLISNNVLIDHVIPITLRQYSGNFIKYRFSKEYALLRNHLKHQDYDYVIDAQGLLKSAWFCKMAAGVRCGYSWSCAREPLASMAYQKRFAIAKTQHAVNRTRQLLSQVLDYPLPKTIPNYQLQLTGYKERPRNKSILFFPGTTWTSKMWPQSYWAELAGQLAHKDFLVHIAWGTEEEFQMASHIARGLHNVSVLPELNIVEMLYQLRHCSGYVAVDTGFAHLAAAANTPGICIMGATNPDQTAPLGEAQQYVFGQLPCCPCHKRVCHYQGKSQSIPACLEAIQPHDIGLKLLALMKIHNPKECIYE